MASDLARQLEPVFEDFPDIRAVYLFGSRATGRASAGSDYDLGVVSKKHQSDYRLDLLVRLEDTGLFEGDIDLVFFHEAGLVLQFEMVSPHCLLYRQQDFVPGQFFSRVAREYWDFLPYLKIQREALKARLAGEELPEK